MNADSVNILFRGINGPLTLKKRYRELLKIFHPDNLSGDMDMVQLINKEYEKLKKVNQKLRFLAVFTNFLAFFSIKVISATRKHFLPQSLLTQAKIK